MKDIEIPLPGDTNCLTIDKSLESICLSCGLRVTLKARLRKFSGSTHWHFKNGDEQGTLELTLWPARKRAWFSIQDGRPGTWIEKKVTELQNAFQQTFRQSQAI